MPVLLAINSSDLGNIAHTAYHAKRVPALHGDKEGELYFGGHWYVYLHARLTNTCNRPVIAHLTFVGYNALGKIIGSEQAPYDLGLGQSRVIGERDSGGHNYRSRVQHLTTVELH